MIDTDQNACLDQLVVEIKSLCEEGTSSLPNDLSSVNQSGPESSEIVMLMAKSYSDVAWQSVHKRSASTRGLPCSG